MAYVHCPECAWSQDDFWNEGYNPITFLEKAWKKELLVTPLNAATGCDCDGDPVSNREILVRQFENAAKKVRGMVFRTRDEVVAAEWKCPRCGEHLVED